MFVHVIENYLKLLNHTSDFYKFYIDYKRIDINPFNEIMPIFEIELGLN